MMRILPNRKIATINQRAWQFFRWMDIYGPSDHGNALHEDLYLRRLYVLRTPWFGVMLHWIKREDWDRDALHNHPWEFWRLILSGGYVETVAYATGDTELCAEVDVEHKLGSFSKFPSGAYHRIRTVKPHTVTLVINGPKTRSWGFFVPGEGEIHWRDYLSPGLTTDESPF